MSCRLVAFLCSKDPSAIQYATFTQRACVRDGIQFELKELPRTDLEDALIEANNVHGVAQLVCTNRMQDPSIHGILVYYPVFGLMDTYLQDVVCIEKDVEGMNTKYGSTFEIGRLFKGLTHVNRCRFNLYHNIRYFDEAKTKKCILPCTAIAIVKIIDTVGMSSVTPNELVTFFVIGEYNKKFLEGEHLQNKVITVINRSEIVGRPLASMLANDGAIVYSIDITGCIIFQKGKVPGTIKMIESDISTEDAVRKSNIVVTGVPSPSYKVVPQTYNVYNLLDTFRLDTRGGCSDKFLILQECG